MRGDVARALQMLAGSGSDLGAEGLIVEATRWLEGAADKIGDDPEEGLAEPLAALARASIELGEATRGVEDALARMDFDPRALEAAEERLFALRALARKHDVLPDDLATLASHPRWLNVAATLRIASGEKLNCRRTLKSPRPSRPARR